MTMRKIILGLLALLVIGSTVGDAQQTLPASTVVGRLGIGPGPSQAIPFVSLKANLGLQTTVKDFGAKCDGVTDDTAAINAAELNASTGIAPGILNFPTGTCIVTGVTKRTGTIWQGEGIGQTVIKLKASTTTNAVVAGLNAYTLFGTASFAGILNWGLRDLTIDGNRTNGGVSDCLGIFGYAFSIDRIESQNCTGWGIRSELPIAVDGSLATHSDNASSWVTNSLIHDNNLGGVSWAGPQDSSLVGNYIYRNLVVGLKAINPGGYGVKIVSNHFWGSNIAVRQAVTGVQLDTIGNTLSNNAIEGATGQQVWIRNNNNTIIGGRVFYQNSTPNAVTGIRIGDTGGGLTSAANNINTEITNTQASSVFFDNDGGLNNINVIAFNSNVGSSGYTGTPAVGNSVLSIFASGSTTTNPSLLSFPTFRLQPVASTVNFPNIFPSATGLPVRYEVDGTDTNIGVNLSSKGTGAVTIATNGSAQTQVQVAHTANAVNFFGMTGAIATAFPSIFSQGTDTNIGINFIGKGNSALSFLTNGGAQNQFQVLHTASATRNLTVTGSNGGNPIVASTAGGLNLAPSNGHVPITGGSAPTLTAGCNGAGSVISGTDAAGTITGQTAAATTCTLQFGTVYAAAPNCVASGQTTPLTGAFTPSTTTLVVNFASTANYKWSYVCFGS